MVSASGTSLFRPFSLLSLEVEGVWVAEASTTNDRQIFFRKLVVVAGGKGRRWAWVEGRDEVKDVDTTKLLQTAMRMTAITPYSPRFIIFSNK